LRGFSGELNRNRIEAAVIDGLREMLKNPDFFQGTPEAAQRRAPPPYSWRNQGSQRDRTRAGEIDREIGRIWGRNLKDRPRSGHRG
jgi:hypothetical protein